MSLPYNKSNTPKARKLRKALTPQEKRLWYNYLSDYRPRFLRQKPIGSYIVDFYCHKARLVIEIDGAHHFTTEGHSADNRRTEALEEFGLIVIRFSNAQIEHDFMGVCLEIHQAVIERIRELEQISETEQ